ncbi:hypothetical protein GCM10009817_05970 [Terrabacter lapilli]|uniref:Uncharacterized protein n=1 Tax=Terrabacter lapilli TaxID=436231 RepID=A0ABP5CWG9_9MICO|nr:hypothetical protein [Terrabacter sp.]
MSNDDTNTAAEAPDTTQETGYVGRHARPGAPDQGPDEDTSYDAKHDDIEGPPGSVQR